MTCDRLVRFPRLLPPAAQAVREFCWPLRERSWALKGLSAMYLADAARLRAQSEDIIARTRRFSLHLV